jgi:hypothetical protein
MGIRAVPKDLVPKAVASYLGPDERRVFTVRRHPFVLVLLAFPLVLDVTALTLHATNGVRGTTRALVILLILIAPCGYLVCHGLTAWLRAFVVLTPEQLLVVSWLRNRRVTVIPVAEAGEMTFFRTMTGRLVGYGTLQLKLPGARRRVLKIRFLPYPEQLYLEAAGLVFPGGNLDLD